MSQINFVINNKTNSKLSKVSIKSRSVTTYVELLNEPLDAGVSISELTDINAALTAHSIRFEFAGPPTSAHEFTFNWTWQAIDFKPNPKVGDRDHYVELTIEDARVVFLLVPRGVWYQYNYVRALHHESARR